MCPHLSIEPAAFFEVERPITNVRRVWFGASVSLLIVLGATNSRAADGGTPSLSSEPTPLRYNLPVDLGVIAGSGALALTLELMSSKVAPKTCTWCDRDSNGRDNLNGFDAWMRDTLRWSNTNVANKASNVIGYILAPMAGVGIGAALSWRENRFHTLPVDVLIVAESAMLSIDLNQVTKLAAARERPYVHFSSDAEREANRKKDDNVSFYSGHTSFAFALATSAGTVASMRGYRWAPALWVTGLTLASLTGYLRIAADRHYATDVLTGALVGSAIGIGVPYFFHGPASTSAHLSAAPTHGGSQLTFSGYW